MIAFAVLAAPVAAEVDRLSHGEPLCPPAAEAHAAYDPSLPISPIHFWEVSIASGVCAIAGLRAEPAKGI